MMGAMRTMRLAPLAAAALLAATANAGAAQVATANGGPANGGAGNGAAAVRQRTILFVGNSFTQGSASAVRGYRADLVKDLNGGGNGGIAALFRVFADQAGLDWRVSVEAEGGRTLAFHLAERKARIDRPWDVVILQEYSTLDPQRPGDAANYIRDAGLLAALFRRSNPRARIELMATWTRADQTYRAGGRWYGKPVTAMADDMRAAADRAKAASRDIDGVIPVGQAWSRAIAAGVADGNPYDGIAFGQVDLWAHDQYHASIYGSYLEALVVFGRVTGVDPRSLGERERAADDLGISQVQAKRLQQIAAEALAAERSR